MKREMPEAYGLAPEQIAIAVSDALSKNDAVVA